LIDKVSNFIAISARPYFPVAAIRYRCQDRSLCPRHRLLPAFRWAGVEGDDSISLRMTAPDFRKIGVVRKLVPACPTLEVPLANPSRHRRYRLAGFGIDALRLVPLLRQPLYFCGEATVIDI